MMRNDNGDMVPFLFLLGLFMGSFLYCISENRDLLSRSRCDHCGHVLNVFDLIPLLSFLFLKGRCRYCGEKISIFYPLSEILTGILYAGNGLCIKDLVSLFEHLILTSVLLEICFHDLKTYTIRNGSIVFGILLRFLFCLSGEGDFLDDLSHSFLIVLPFVLLSIILTSFTKKEVIGGGDLKLIFLLSLYTAPYHSLIALFLSSLFGLFVMMICGKEKIPFAPCLCLGYLIVFLFVG